MLKTLDGLTVVLVVGALCFLAARYIPPETRDFSALTSAEASHLVRTCQYQGTPNFEDPPCLIRQGSNVYGLSVIVTGTMPSGETQGLVNSYSRRGVNNFTVQIPTYVQFPRGEHILPGNPVHDGFMDAFRSDGRLTDPPEK